MTARVLIAGASTRAAADSAARAGFDVEALDAYGDLDQHPAVRAWTLPRGAGLRFTAGGAARAARAVTCDAVAYLSPFENHARAVATLARGRALWGNPPDVVRRVRDPRLVADAMHRHGLPSPAVGGTDAPGGGLRWLLKPRASGGGHRVREWHPGMRLSSRAYLQEHVEGVPGSIVFLAAGGRALPLAVTRQLVGDPEFGSAGYRYCGSLLAGAGDPEFGPGSLVAARAAALAGLMAAEFGLIGVNGIDFVAAGGVPFPVEVNPRWCSSIELVDRAHAIAVFAAHARACVSGSLSGLESPGPSVETVGKAVVFARDTVVAGDTRGWCGDASVRDVPVPGTRVPAGGPVCTVLAAARDPDTCRDALVRRAARVYAEVSAWPRP